MHVIAVANQKGGVGKSTLSAHIALEAERRRDGPVAVLDTDPQGSLTVWWNLRKAEDIVLVSPDAGIPAAVEECRRMKFSVLVIDTPPAINDTIARVLAVADLAVIPITPSPLDVQAAGRTVDLVEEAGRPFVFVLNNANNRARITTDTATALSEHGAVCRSVIHHRTDFRSCMIDGRGVSELDAKSKSAAEIAALWTFIKARLAKDARNAAA